jgi:hypothetical protein
MNKEWRVLVVLFCYNNLHSKRENLDCYQYCSSLLMLLYRNRYFQIYIIAEEYSVDPLHKAPSRLLRLFTHIIIMNLK